jgi:hypothetical protein
MERAGWGVQNEHPESTMTHRQHELKKVLGMIAQQSGATLVSIAVTGSGHMRLTFENKGGARGSITAASSPSSCGSLRRVKADARRLLRRLTA